jgi:copper chaperone
MTTVLKVEDATCGHCKATIETAMVSVQGVETADLDLDSKLLRVTHDEAVEPATLRRVIEDAGYTPEMAS